MNNDDIEGLNLFDSYIYAVMDEILEANSLEEVKKIAKSCQNFILTHND